MSETAKSAYKARTKQIKNKIKALEAKLKKHEANFLKNNTNWGYPADLCMVLETLERLDTFHQ